MTERIAYNEYAKLKYNTIMTRLHQFARRTYCRDTYSQ